MFELNPARAMHLHRGTIDFRKSINGLAGVVEHELGLSAFANAVFVFANCAAIAVVQFGRLEFCARPVDLRRFGKPPN